MNRHSHYADYLARSRGQAHEACGPSFMNETASRILNVLQPEVGEVVRDRGLSLIQKLLEHYAALHLCAGGNWVDEKQDDARFETAQALIEVVAKEFGISLDLREMSREAWELIRRARQRAREDDEAARSWWHPKLGIERGPNGTFHMLLVPPLDP